MKFSGKFASAAIFAAFGVAAMATADIGPFSSIGRSIRTSSALTEATVGFAAPVVALEIYAPGGSSALPQSLDGVRRMRLTKIDAFVTATGGVTGKVKFSLGGRTLKTADLPVSGAVRAPIDLSSIENLGSARLKAVVTYTDINFSDDSKEIEIDVDTEGPLLSTIRLAGDPNSDSVGLILRFRSDDLDTASAQDSTKYRVERSGAGGAYVQIPNDATGVLGASVNGAVVTLSLKGPLKVGKYRVTATPAILDKIGNPAGRINLSQSRTQQVEFTPAVYGAGPAIHFPQYTKREKLDPNTNFNPGDHVETRVVRLYYNRDAHRVAQIINRDIRQLNKAGVNNARTVAKQARSEADAAQGKREREEENATEVATQLRTMERQLNVKQQAAERARNKLAQVKDLQQQLEELGPESAVSNADTIPSSIVAATITNAKIIGATVQLNTIVGGVTDAAGVTTGGSIGIGTLTNGRFGEAGLITWDEAGESKFDGKVRYKYRGTMVSGTLSPGSSAQVSGGAINGTTTANVTSGEITGSFVQNVSITNATINSLSKQTINENQPTINAIKRELKIQTGSENPETGGVGSALAYTVTEADKAVTEMETKIAQQQIAISAAKKKVSQSEREERIANRTQFEAEVASGTADPDSYAPADLDSIDPVMQVSISVIGEGVIQLRGPIRGINEIRTMINQIDSPLGQVKVGLFTVQINGEEGDKMDEVAARLEGYIDLSRFLTNQSLQLLRRAVQETAGQIAGQFDDHQYPQHRQIDRDRKYVYAFFGRDFVDELYEMDSEFLRTENKLLSIHAMDTVSLPQATFILALAKNSIREQILDRFMMLVQSELPVAEYSQRRTAGMLKRSRDINAFRRLISIPGFPKDPERVLAKYRQQDMQKYCKKAAEIYRFNNLMNFFRADVYNDDVMTPLQREFIRLAQIFKSQMVAEIELKQRVVERALIQDSNGNEEELRRVANEEHLKAVKALRDATSERQRLAAEVQKALLYGELAVELKRLIQKERDLWAKVNALGIDELSESVGPSKFYERLDAARSNGKVVEASVKLSEGKAIQVEFPLEPDSEGKWGGAIVEVTGDGITNEDAAAIWRGKVLELVRLTDSLLDSYDEIQFSGEEAKRFRDQEYFREKARTKNFDGEELKPDAQRNVGMIANIVKTAYYLHKDVGQHVELVAQTTAAESRRIAEDLLSPDKSKVALVELVELTKRIIGFTKDDKGLRTKAEKAIGPLTDLIHQFVTVQVNVSVAEQREKSSRVDLDHKKLLDYLIDEKEEKYIELVEGTRSHIAQMDNYLKRLAIALEDDFKVQFYDPAFEGVRAEGRDESVNFGQIERTTILTNNRTFAKVSPQASMEFDLPKRAPVVVEAMSGAKALMQDYGALVNDPTFIGLTGALSGSPAVGGAGNGSPPQVKPLFPTQGTDSQSSFLSGGPPGTPGGRQKTSLEQLIPDPAVYKIQTGTGFEIRPVIQPDGHSIMYDFNYLYTTNIREPVDPDEKHLGRIKQHYIHTQVQTSSFELREISRYQVALKVSRTSRGVPLLEDIPIAGALFKPAPSAESSLQQNIILGQTTVYPTLFDLMGLRWSRHVADLDHMKLRELEHVVRGRNRSINDHVFERASEKVDSFLNIEKDNDHYRKDFYRPPSQPTPYHPNGYIYTKEGKEITDPTGRNFYRRDPRPEEYRVPQYDDRRRGPSQHYHEGLETIDDSSPEYIEEISEGLPAATGQYVNPVEPQAASTFPLFPQAVAPKAAIRRMSYERTAPVRK